MYKRSTPEEPYYLSEPPSVPSRSWRWQCKCGISYGFGITLYCLQCGRPYRGRPTRKFRASAAQFDYAAWAKRNKWRRLQAIQAMEPGVVHPEMEMYSISARIGGRTSSPPPLRRVYEAAEQARLRNLARGSHHCEKDCDYPSQCTVLAGEHAQEAEKRVGCTRRHTSKA